MNEANGERVLSLNLKDRAAHSILYAYVFARGVESTSSHTDDVLSLATLLSNNPDPKTDTATQDWEQFLQWTTPITDEDKPTHSCAIDELELCIKGAGYEVAAVILRALPEAEREPYLQEFRRLHYQERAPKSPEELAQQTAKRYEHNPYVVATRTGATVTFTEREENND